MLDNAQHPPGLRGLIKSVVGALVRPFVLIVNPIAERIGSWLRRKPRLHIPFHPLACLWCIAKNGNQEIMQIVFTADFAHDGRHEGLIIVNAYPKGTQSFQRFEKFKLAPCELSVEGNCLLVTPVIGTKGNDWTGRIIFGDQFHRKYKSPEYTFKWAGPLQPPSAPTPAQ